MFVRTHKQRIALGRCSVSLAALQACKAARVSVQTYLNRHAEADWGVPLAEEAVENDGAFDSEYHLGRISLLIRTAPDCSCTRVMLVHEADVEQGV